ncbi:MAG: hypothetical protein ACO1TE_21230 [Prosthecobacter sp.]
MHQTRISLVTVALLSTVLVSKSQAQGEPSVLSAQKPKVAILAEDVTVDGTRRPDLGRALADSLSTNLLRRGQTRVFNLTTQETKTGTQTLALPGKDTQPQTPVMDKDVDYLLTFNLFSNASEHRITVKKTRVATSELVDSHQFFTYGRVSDVFSLVNKIADRVDPLPIRHAFPATQSPAAIRWSQPDPDPLPYQSFWTGDYTNPASPAYDPWQANLAAQYDLNNVPKALTYQELGSIQHIDNTWKFTIVRPAKGVVLSSNDPLHVLYDEGDVYADLRVGTVERDGAVADFGGMTPEHHPLFKGDKVFGWHAQQAPPVKKK